MLTADTLGRVTFVNRELTELLGVSESALLGHAWKDILRGQDLSGLLARTLEDISTAEPLRDEIRYTRPDGRTLWLEAGCAVCASDESGGRVATFVDITDRKNAEIEAERNRENLETDVRARTAELENAVAELEMANSIKDEFIANVRHELRTPLNSIIGFSAVLRDGIAGPLNEEQTRQTGMIHDAGVRLHELIKDILYVSRIDSGIVELQPEDVDLSQIVPPVLEALKPQAERKGLELNVDVSSATAHTDAWALGKILGHLASNAIKFTDRGGITVQVQDHGDHIALMVRDTGPGIAPEDLEHAFDRFYQIRPANGGKVGGAGLGLSLARTLAQKMGGDLTITSRVGQGTEAQLIVPTHLSTTS
jgi:PAS domain S-box-containing protein